MTTATIETGTTVRVSIREIREYSYRALLAHGASAGEAAHAAELVLHAELYDGCGLAGLLEDLSRGPWPEAGLPAFSRAPGTAALELSCGTRSGELRAGPPIIDLAAGSAGVPVLVSAEALPSSTLLEGALLDAAAATRAWVCVAARASTGALVVRVATPQGDLGTGELPARALPDLERLARPAATVVLAGPEAEMSHAAGLTWRDADARARRRRQAAFTGVRLDRDLWTEVAAHARLFLVPEAGA